jgi:hypothetical protein
MQDTRANHPAAGKAGMRQAAFGRHYSGLPEPGRSAVP